jgi:hypothetical protein
MVVEKQLQPLPCKASHNFNSNVNGAQLKLAAANLKVTAKTAATSTTPA